MASATEYQFRLVAKNELGTSQGVERSFKTKGPALGSVSLKGATETSATFQATINPNGADTSYVFEYVTLADFEQGGFAGATSVPAGGESIGGGTGDVEVSATAEGLEPRTPYRFRLVAANADGSISSTTKAFTTRSTGSVFGSCPNDRFRTGPSANLPDCRAYEQVTPNDKFGSDAYGSEYSVETSEAGDGITSYTFSGFPNSSGFQYANVFLTSRVGNDWSTAGLNTPPSYGDTSDVLAWTPDLRLSFASAYDFEGAGFGSKVVMRDSADDSRTVLVPQSAELHNFTLAGAFDDDSKVVFEADGSIPVTSGPAATATEQGNIYLYDRDSGELTLVGLLPDSACATPPCVPAEGSKLPAAFNIYVQDGHVVSPSGDIYFTDRSTGQLYLRRDASGSGATTEPVSASHKTNGEGPGGVASNSPQPATFWGATPDGSKAFLTSTEELTNDANTGPEPFLTPAIGRANSDGSSVQHSFIATKAKWTAVDSAHIYWTNTSAGTIGRAEIDGSNPDPSFITGLENPEGIAVDSGHIYWAEAGDRGEGHGTIDRATLAGGSIEKEFITGASSPRGVAVNSEYVFWTGNAGIGRATITGANSQQSLISRGEGERAWGIAANATSIYWIQAGYSATVFKAKLSGEGGYELLDAGTGIEVRGLAIDSNYVYWSDVTNGRIGRGPLDLSSADTKFITNVHGATGIAADANHVYWASDPSASGPPANPGSDLYRRDAASGELIDLAPDSADSDGAEVLGVLGYSDNGEYTYFAANADLDGSGPAQAGDCSVRNTGYVYFAGSCSVYLWQADGAGTCTTAGGCVNFVSSIDLEGGNARSDGLNWIGTGSDMKTSRVSADGRSLVFRSQAKLTDYDNTPAGEACGEGFTPQRPCPEYYRYDAESGQVTCITCNPTGAPPVGAPDLKNPDMYHAPSSNATYNAQYFLSRNLSADGDHFFFQSVDKLVPADVNGETKCDTKDIARLGAGPSCRDVYEWEAPGTPGGSCTTNSGTYSPANGGCLYLLSTGTGIYPSYLADVSESGDTAFIFSRQKLVPSDEDTQEDIYAVKVNGGLLSQNTPRPANCEGDACRGASSQPSNAPGAGSGVFEGPPNPKQSTNQTRCPKGKKTVHTKGKTRCVAKKHKKKAHKSKSKAHKRAANNDRRASR